MFFNLVSYVLGALLLVPSSLAIPTYSHSPSHVRFELDLTWGPFSPDGFTRNTILMNGQLPGPPLEVGEGDNVEVVVRNHLPFGITVHFHGIEQLNTPWSDGVPGLSQRPIQPGSAFVYRWTANQYGTYWYHAHQRGHVSDGLYGAIIVRPSRNEPTAFGMISNSTSNIHAMRRAENHPRPLMVSDWSHFTSEEFLDIQNAAGIDDFCIDSILINGKGSEICLPQAEINQLTNPLLIPILNGSTLTAKGCLPATLPIVQGGFPHDFSKIPPTAFDVCQPSQGQTEIIKVDPRDGWVSINIISTAGVNSLEVSIDEHPMWIYAVDGRHIVPEEVDAINIPNGNRYSALVKLDKPVGDYTIRVATLGLNQVISGYGKLSYVGSRHNNTSAPYINAAGANLTANVRFFDETKVVAFPPLAPAPTADATYHLRIDRFGAAFKWTLSGKAAYGLDLDTEVPLLFDRTSAEAMNPNLTITTKMGEWVDLVIQVAAPLQPPHPLHKHSNKAFIIGAGQGAFNWSTVAEAMQEIPQFFNLQTPPVRDGFTTIPSAMEPTWMVVRYQVVNPGAFLFHCHIQTHLDGGMAVAILDGIDAFPQIPQEYLNDNGFRRS